MFLRCILPCFVLISHVALLPTQNGDKTVLPLENHLTQGRQGKCRANRTKECVYYISGYDYDEKPVVVMEWGKWDVAYLVENPTELEIFERNVDQYADDVSSGLFTKQVNNTESWSSDLIVNIIDFDGFDIRRMNSVDAIAMTLRNFGKLQRCVAQTAYGFIINANPLVDQLINMAKPFMGNYLERVDVYGTNSQKWIPQLLKKIPSYYLPPAYGGNDTDFEPVIKFDMLSCSSGYSYAAENLENRNSAYV